MQITKVICIFDGIASNGITREDAHRKMYELGSRIDAEEQYPVEISAVCDLGGKKFLGQEVCIAKTEERILVRQS